jgi:hypothetical protein
MTLMAARADEAVRFGFSGTEYEIDLSKKNAAAFRKHNIQHGRRLASRRCAGVPVPRPIASVPRLKYVAKV